MVWEPVSRLLASAKACRFLFATLLVLSLVGVAHAAPPGTVGFSAGCPKTNNGKIEAMGVLTYQNGWTVQSVTLVVTPVAGGEKVVVNSNTVAAANIGTWDDGNNNPRGPISATPSAPGAQNVYAEMKLTDGMGATKYVVTANFVLNP